jgi:hypothetical protein
MKAGKRKWKAGPTAVEEKGEGWQPTNSEDELTDEERSLDIGESGQFAPGGYYNQERINAPRRIDLDDYIVPPARESRITRE